MIKFSNNGHLIETVEELKNVQTHLTGAKTLYLDFETQSKDPKKKSVNPWHDCYFLGACILVDDDENSYYIPDSIPFKDVKDFLLWLIRSCDRIVAQNAKYDLHVFSNIFGEILPEHIEYVDTLTAAKLLNSDRFRYGLKELSREWLEEDISTYESRMNPYFYYAGKNGKDRGNRFNQDYGAVPTDILAEYGCQDVLTTRKLYQYIEEHMHEECRRVYEIEKRITYILYRIEQEGMRVDVKKLVNDGYKRIPNFLKKVEQKIHALSGKYIRPNVNDDCHEVLCIDGGLPVLEWTDKTHNPSFGKDAMVGYLALTKDNRYLNLLVRAIRYYKKYFKVHSSFTLPYLGKLRQHKHKTGHYLHCFYNQIVRTGRMSSSEPNFQQLSTFVKSYIIPEDECYLVSIDLSQIEFRIIAHYLDQSDLIRAYQTNPDTDYHQQVADMCGIDRKPAKTVNFLKGYGGGKYKLRQEFKKQPALAGNLPKGIDFETFCSMKADEVNDKYHEKLHQLRPTMQAASQQLKIKGYVKTLYGRHRHLPTRIWLPDQKKWINNTFKAFNSASQGTAADILKDVTIRLWDLIHKNNWKTKIVALVHDDWIFQCPKEEFETVVPQLQEEINKNTCGLRVPIRCDMSYSDKNWARCK